MGKDNAGKTVDQFLSVSDFLTVQFYDFLSFLKKDLGLSFKSLRILEYRAESETIFPMCNSFPEVLGSEGVAVAENIQSLEKVGLSLPVLTSEDYLLC